MKNGKVKISYEALKLASAESVSADTNNPNGQRIPIGTASVAYGCGPGAALAGACTPGMTN